MARSRSEDKREAILKAAEEVFVERGPLQSPTAEISRRAAVAEGTLFTYFKTKDELINALYQQKKSSLAEAMLLEYPKKKKVRRRLRHLWNAYVGWIRCHPGSHRVLTQIRATNLLTEESQQVSLATYVEVQNTIHEATSQGRLRPGLATGFVVSAFEALATITAETVQAQSDDAKEVMAAGFKTFWNGCFLKKHRGKE